MQQRCRLLPLTLLLPPLFAACLHWQTLCNLEEHGMVRHEAAEAIGSLGTPEALALLEEFKTDGELLVLESVLVALDTAEYWAEL